MHHENVKYDGYRLTNLGYDYLAMKTLVNRGRFIGFGRQIGVGKESDIFEVLTEEHETLCLKLHRLGRTSFRDVKTKRDYLGHRRSYGSWLYLSRLAALKEYAFMLALHENNFPVPKPIDVNRHGVLMERVNAFPMVNVRQISNPGKVYDFCMAQILRLAEHGLIHGDFNEFNLMISDNEEITIIDFPQMVSIQHKNAKYYFERDVQCIKVYFEKKYRFKADENQDSAPKFEDLNFSSKDNLDKKVAASGFDSKRKEEFEQLSLVLKRDEDEDFEEEEEGEEEDCDIYDDSKQLHDKRNVDEDDIRGDRSNERLQKLDLYDRDGDSFDRSDEDNSASDNDEGINDMPMKDSTVSRRNHMSVHEIVTKSNQSQKAKSKKASAFKTRNTNKSRNAGKRKGDKRVSLDF